MIRKQFKVTDLSVKYKHKLILTNINFTIETGKIIGIIGPNGAGKSTLFKAILGLINKEQGTMIYNNIPLKKQRELIAYIPQRSQIDWDFPITVWDIVLMGRIIRTGWLNQFSEESYEKVDEALEKLEITHLKNRKIGELSGGQQQRVFLARSIAQGAEIFCLDEPLSGVDYKTQANIFKILQDLAIQNKLILVIHHDLSDIVKYFDELILLNQKIIASGQCEDVLKENLLHQAYI